MPDVGSHVLIAHVERLADHHRNAAQAAQDDHARHATPPDAPMGPGGPIAPQRPNLGPTEGPGR